MRVPYHKRCKTSKHKIAQTIFSFPVFHFQLSLSPPSSHYCAAHSCAPRPFSFPFSAFLFQHFSISAFSSLSLPPPCAHCGPHEPPHLV